jgi:hypothetical protein
VSGADEVSDTPGYEGFPRAEGLTKRSPTDSRRLPANLAEGCGRSGDAVRKILLHCDGISNRTDYHLLLAKDLQPNCSAC